jgi:hypothetical protein
MTPKNQQIFRFSIQISQQQFLRYYQGSANSIQVISECGRRLSFPVSRLRPFLSQTGIQGRFQMTVDTNNRFLDLKKII